jgi:hypothetical protein
VTTAGRKLVAGYPPFDWIMVWDPKGRLDTIHIPARLRRGVPPGVYQRYFVRERWDFNQSLRKLSLLEGLWTLPDGKIAAVHMDVSPQVERGRVVHVAGKAYVTLLDLDKRMACLDSPVPSEAETMPVVTIHGQQLAVLEQVVVANPKPDARSFLRTYRIDSAPCDWVPLT